MTKRQKTEDLILSLAAQPLPRAFSPLAMVALMSALASVVVGVFLAQHGVRADLVHAWSKLVTVLKSALPLLVCLLAIWLAIQSARPEALVRLWPLALPFAGALCLVAYRLATMGEVPVVSEMMGSSALACLTFVTKLALFPLAGGIWLLRRGATTRPALTGALLGLGAGAGVTVGYALHCTEDSPLFFVVWYGLAILISGLIGALAGGRLLRW